MHIVEFCKQIEGLEVLMGKDGEYFGDALQIKRVKEDLWFGNCDYYCLGVKIKEDYGVAIVFEYGDDLVDIWGVEKNTLYSHLLRDVGEIRKESCFEEVKLYLCKDEEVSGVHKLMAIMPWDVSKSLYNDVYYVLDSVAYHSIYN